MGLIRREKRGNIRRIPNALTGQDDTYRRAKNSGLWILTDPSGRIDSRTAAQFSTAQLDKMEEDGEVHT